MDSIVVEKKNQKFAPDEVHEHMLVFMGSRHMQEAGILRFAIHGDSNLTLPDHTSFDGHAPS